MNLRGVGLKGVVAQVCLALCNGLDAKLSARPRAQGMVDLLDSEGHQRRATTRP